MDFTHLQIYNFHHFVEEENPSWCVWNEVILKRNPGNPTLITPFWKVKLWGKSGGVGGVEFIWGRGGQLRSGSAPLQLVRKWKHYTKYPLGGARIHTKPGTCGCAPGPRGWIKTFPSSRWTNLVEQTGEARFQPVCHREISSSGLIEESSGGQTGLHRRSATQRGCWR